MKKVILLLVITVSLFTGLVSADTFGTGANQFDIDFVTISGDASSANGTNVSQFSPGDSGYDTFIDPANYRMGTYEITNDQWSKFKAIQGNDTRANIPTALISWHEAAQFVNWLNISSGHQGAYNFTNTTFSLWDTIDNGYDESNPYRNKYAYYFLPSEDEWVKAAYWNGTNLQTWASVGDEDPTQNGWNYYDNGYAAQPYGRWAVGNGSKEINGTYDMMGNVWEWIETPYAGDYTFDADRVIRGGAYHIGDYLMKRTNRGNVDPINEYGTIGFRVASVIPEPATLSLLALGAFLAGRKKRT